MLKGKKGQIGIREMIGTLIVGAVLFMVGMFTYSKVSSSIDQGGFSAAENTTMTNVRTNVLAGFDLGTISFIVLAAGTIIAIIFLAFR
jgi:hypothetical protein